MNFGAILASVLKLAVPAVLTIEQVMGQAATGASKAEMAETALQGAFAGASSVLNPDGDNEQLAALSAGLVQAGIKTAVDITRASGAYQQASTVAEQNQNTPAQKQANANAAKTPQPQTAATTTQAPAVVNGSGKPVDTVGAKQVG